MFYGIFNNLTPSCPRNVIDSLYILLYYTVTKIFAIKYSLRLTERGANPLRETAVRMTKQKNHWRKVTSQFEACMAKIDAEKVCGG